MEKYRPGSGTEGMMFIDSWCSHCARDKPMSEGADYDQCGDDEICEIIAKTFAYEVHDAEYPPEWTLDPENGNPICTAFIRSGDTVPTDRCMFTKDMFSDQKGKA